MGHSFSRAAALACAAAACTASSVGRDFASTTNRNALCSPGSPASMRASGCRLSSRCQYFVSANDQRRQQSGYQLRNAQASLVQLFSYPSPISHAGKHNLLGNSDILFLIYHDFPREKDKCFGKNVDTVFAPHSQIEGTAAIMDLCIPPKTNGSSSS